MEQGNDKFTNCKLTKHAEKKLQEHDYKYLHKNTFYFNGNLKRKRENDFGFFETFFKEMQICF